MVAGVLLQLPSGLANGGLLQFAAENVDDNTTVTSYSSGFSTASSLVEVAIGLTVGLFVSAASEFSFPTRHDRDEAGIADPPMSPPSNSRQRSRRRQEARHQPFVVLRYLLPFPPLLPLTPRTARITGLSLFSLTHDISSHLARAIHWAKQTLFSADFAFRLHHVP